MGENYTYVKVANTSELIKEGDYEARVERVEKKTLSNGRDKLSIMFRIRDDVEQAYKRMVVFEDIWSEKEHPEYFNRKRLNQLLGTQDLADGTVFETIDDIINYIKNANLIIHVSSEFDDYKGEDKNVVKFYKSSQAKGQTLGTTTTEQSKVVEVVDDLPF